jgi:hypothetical protein
MLNSFHAQPDPITKIATRCSVFCCAIFKYMENPEIPRLTGEQKSRAAWEKLHVVRPVTPPAAFGLGLCDSEKVLAPEDLQALHHDLAKLALDRKLSLPDIYID